MQSVRCYIWVKLEPRNCQTSWVVASTVIVCRKRIKNRLLVFAQPLMEVGLGMAMAGCSVSSRRSDTRRCRAVD